MIKWFADNKLG